MIDLRAVTTPDLMRQQYGRNAESLARMAAKADEVAPKKYRGQPASYWHERAETFARVAKMNDAELGAYLDECSARVRAAVAKERAIAAGSATRDVHISKSYENGTGHVESRDGKFRVSFYGRRVVQAEASTLQDARFALRRLAMGGR